MKSNSKVDRLGFLMAQIAELQAEANKIKKSLLSSYGDGNLFGVLFEVNLQHNVSSPMLDRELLERRFGVENVAKCCKTRTQNKVTVHARTVE